jgi:quercetin dioxygenase-like cupin family protein
MPIGLAPTARSRFEAHTINHAALDKAPLLDLPFNPGVRVRGYSAINQPNCQVIIEDFMPGDSFEWTFTHDEMQYCISGEMEVEVYLPPLYSEVVKTKILPGTVYTYPVGARKHVKITSTEPFRHICFCPPSPDYPFPTLDDLIAAQE